MTIREQLEQLGVTNPGNDIDEAVRWALVEVAQRRAELPDDLMDGYLLSIERELLKSLGVSLEQDLAQEKALREQERLNAAAIQAQAMLLADMLDEANHG